jgi:hypothetical protein
MGDQAGKGNASLESGECRKFKELALNCIV